MRVLHVIPSLSTVHGGPTAALMEMERVLTARGMSVVTITTDDDGPKRRRAPRVDQEVVDGGAVRHYFPKVTDFYKYSPPLGRWLRLHAGEFDLIHVHALFSYASTVACRVAQSVGIPYIVRPLGTLAHYGVTSRRP